MRIICRILIGTVIVIVALAALVAGVIVIDGLISRSQLDAATNTRIPNSGGGPDIRAYVARPSIPGPHPAAIMIHEFWGMNSEIAGKAQALAEEGYVVIAPDLFRGSTANWVPRAIYQVVSNPQEQLLADLDAVFAWLSSQPDVKPDRVAIMGFCFGGRTSLRYSLSNNKLAGTIVLYGSPVTDPNQLKSLSGPVLGIFGGADNSIPISEVKAFEAALNEAGVPNKISIYENQPHAFVKSIEEIRQGGVQGQAWGEVLAFLKETLQEDSSLRRNVAPTFASDTMDWGYWLMVAYEHTFGAERHRH